MKTEVQQRAEFSQVRYGQCWEDANILVKALKVHEGRKCLSIGSAGDNCFALLAAGAKHVTAVEMNPAQVACIEHRKNAYLTLEYDEFLESLGVTNPDARGTGTIQEGKFENYFKLFRTKILPLAHSATRISALLEPKSAEERTQFYNETWNNRRWRLIFKAFFSRFVMGRLGRDPAFFDYVEGSVADRILERTRYALVELDPSQNPYLHWILTGTFSEILPLALQKENFRKIRQALEQERLTVVPASLEEALTQSNDTFDAFNLSDIFEYMSEDSTKSLLEQILRSAYPGARLAYWNMLAPRSRPQSLAGQIKSCLAEAENLFLQDRAFFYSRFVVEEVI